VHAQPVLEFRGHACIHRQVHLVHDRHIATTLSARLNAAPTERSTK
jgi:hypothetical protein